VWPTCLLNSSASVAVAVAGRIPLPPRYAFGVFYSRYWAYSDEELMDDIVGEYAARGISLDTLVVDMDW
jgi:alpha-glucosidase (family GH31 glycosyl hydrolase)